MTSETVLVVEDDDAIGRALMGALNAQGFGIRSGSFYSPRLCEQLKIDPVDGVVRISLAHYNSTEEVDATFAALEKLI